MPAGNIPNWVNGREIVIPLNEKLRVAVSDWLQRIYAASGSFEYGIASTIPEICWTMAAGS